MHLGQFSRIAGNSRLLRRLYIDALYDPLFEKIDTGIEKCKKCHQKRLHTKICTAISWLQKSTWHKKDQRDLRNQLRIESQWVSPVNGSPVQPHVQTDGQTWQFSDAEFSMKRDQRLVQSAGEPSEWKSCPRSLVGSQIKLSMERGGGHFLILKPCP